MRPDQRWFPTNRAERAAWFGHFAAKFPDYAPALGFTQAEIDAVLADNAVVQFIARLVTTVEAYRAAIIEFQQGVLMGRSDGTMPSLPAVPDLAPPPMVPRGIFERLERTVRRIRAQPAYSDSLGAMLGIIPRRTDLSIASDHKPPIKVKAAAHGYAFEVATVRGSSDQCQVEIRRASSQEWELAGTFTGSAFELSVEPTTPGQAELIDVRLQMIKKNKLVGNPSSIQAVALMP
jgi:hypothetical protein